MKVVLNHSQKTKEVLFMNDIKSLSRSKWICEYRIVFAPKCRILEGYDKLKMDMREILRKLYKQKNVNIVEA